MTTITIDELRERLDEVIDQLAHGEAIAITRDGAVAGTLVPAAGGTAVESDRGISTVKAEDDAFWAPWRKVWEAIGDDWPEGVSAVDAIREDRSRLEIIGEDRRGR